MVLATTAKRTLKQTFRPWCVLLRVLMAMMLPSWTPVRKVYLNTGCFVFTETGVLHSSCHAHFLLLGNMHCYVFTAFGFHRFLEAKWRIFISYKL